MQTAEEVAKKIVSWTESGDSLPVIVVNIANACLGWPYVYGARGEYCNPANRQRFYKDAHQTIKTNCINFTGQVGCTGCKWYPHGRVRCFDCRGFTYWVLLQVGIKIMGSGATSQYNNDDNWIVKGNISDMPNQVCCVFKYAGNKMQHTGLHIGDGKIIHCSNGVQTGKVTDKGWTHYAIPKGLNDVQEDWKPTLRNGSKGKFVIECQTLLQNRGYSLGSYGVDGSFGNCTESAVKKFQRDVGLTADGVVGADTWAALENSTVTRLVTVHIPGLTEAQAKSLLNQYANAYTTEGG